MKHRRWFALALVLCLGVSLAACNLKPARPWPEIVKPGGGELVRGSGKVVEVKTPLSGDAGEVSLRVKGITLRGGGSSGVELVVDESLPREVVLTADDNIAACIRVSYDAAAGAVTVDLNRQAAFAPTQLRIAVGAPVNDLDVNGAWRFTYDCPSVTDCEVAVNGAANGRLSFGALETLRVEVNGASDISLAGTAKRADLTINGAANIEAFDLTAEAADVTINGAGECEITATATLGAEINGVGEVTYAGDPAVSRRVHGLGQVKRK